MVILTADKMFFNQIPFIITYGRGVGLSRTGEQLTTNFTQVLQLYLRGGFTVQTILMHMEFEMVKYLMPMTKINISAANEHVAEVECRIRNINER